MFNPLPRQLQPLIIQVPIILSRRFQLTEVQLHRKLPLIASGLEQQRAQRIHQRTATGEQQPAIALFHPLTISANAWFSWARAMMAVR